MSRILILADDLTGALDSAVGFAGAGRKVVVVREPSGVPAALRDMPDVLAINTGSREVPEDEAVRRVMEALDVLRRDDFFLVIKKVDSRLKGNTGAETRALARWMGAGRQVACPAIPSMGRVVASGHLGGDGVVEPIDVQSRFHDTVDVPDVATDDDLDRLVANGSRETLWIGARGLAFALARSVGVAEPGQEGLVAPVMIANGSRDPVTRAQIGSLPANVSVIEAPNGTAPDAAMPTGPLVVSIAPGDRNIPGQEAADRFAESVDRLAREYQPASLLVCGGESAQAALDRLGINSLQVVAELRPGLPLCVVEMEWGTVRLVTKSGGFGDPELLADVLEKAGA